MAKTLLLQCDAGISGDMTAAALLDLGASREKLLNVLSTVPLDGYRVEISRKRKSSIDCCDFDVILDPEIDSHDHDMEWLFGHNHEQAHHGEHQELHHHGEHQELHHHGEHQELHHHEGHQEPHHHEHAHNEGHSHPGHHHRGLKEIKEIIKQTAMSERAKATAVSIFEVLAWAEAKAHGTSMEEVHFHEVGAVDSIVDIITVAHLLDDLDVGDVIVSHLSEGTGTVRCQHGILPIPVPATCNIASKYNIPIEIIPVKGELVTPTGAAIVASIRTKSRPEGPFAIKAVGLGGGKRDYATSGILRAMIIELVRE